MNREWRVEKQLMEMKKTCTRQCPVCGKLVQTDGSLTRHLHKAHGIFKWSCDLCDEKFHNEKGPQKTREQESQ